MCWTFNIICSDSFLRYPLFSWLSCFNIMQVVKEYWVLTSHLAANRQSYRELIGTLPVYQRFGCNLMTLLQRASETNNGRRFLLSIAASTHCDSHRFQAPKGEKRRRPLKRCRMAKYLKAWCRSDQPYASLRSYLRSMNLWAMPTKRKYVRQCRTHCWWKKIRLTSWYW